MGALPYVIELLSALPSLIKAGMDVTALIQGSTAKIQAMSTENRAPTDAEWAELNAQIKALQNELHKP